jgi:hypothetical protein
MAMQKVTIGFKSIGPTKEFKKISGKRVKTDADHEEMARLEFAAGLYQGQDGQIVIPAQNVMKCLIEGARMTKSGAKVERGVTLAAPEFPLEYDGPTNPDALYSDKRFVSRMTVKVGQSRTMRCRPQFINWQLTIKVYIDPTVINEAELADIAANAGSFMGLGDYRKGGGFGRFEAKVLEMADAVSA